MKALRLPFTGRALATAVGVADAGAGNDNAAGPRIGAGPDRPAGRLARLRDADPYAFRAQHRRMAWFLRLSAGTNIALALSLIFTVSLIGVLMPLKETRVALVRADPADDRIYAIEPIRQDVSGFDLMLEMMARRYVRLLLSIDAVGQTARLQEAFVMTDRAFYDRWKAEHIDAGGLQDLIDRGYQRSIVVSSANRVSTEGGAWQYAVDFVRIDSQDGREVERRRLRAYLSLALRPTEVTARERFENPLGVRVLDLAVKERGPAMAASETGR